MKNIMEKVSKVTGSFTDAATLRRAREMFASYSLDDAESFTIGERYSRIVFNRNGSRYTLCYDDAYEYDKLVCVIVQIVRPI